MQEETHCRRSRRRRQNAGGRDITQERETKCKGMRQMQERKTKYNRGRQDTREGDKMQEIETKLNSEGGKMEK